MWELAKKQFGLCRKVRDSRAKHSCFLFVDTVNINEVTFVCLQNLKIFKFKYLIH